MPTSSPLSNAIPSSNDDDFEDENEADQTCPICLSKPSAARMTKCGHIFCKFPNDKMFISACVLIVGGAWFRQAIRASCIISL